MKPVLLPTAVAAVVIASSSAAFGALSGLAKRTADATMTMAVMPTGNQPTAELTGDDVTLSWTAGTMTPGETPVSGYRVFRQQGAVPAAGTCSGIVTALSCIDQDLAPGNYDYTVLPVYGNWTGVNSPATAVSVPS